MSLYRRVRDDRSVTLLSFRAVARNLSPLKVVRTHTEPLLLKGTSCILTMSLGTEDCATIWTSQPFGSFKATFSNQPNLTPAWASLVRTPTPSTLTLKLPVVYTSCHLQSSASSFPTNYWISDSTRNQRSDLKCTSQCIALIPARSLSYYRHVIRAFTKRNRVARGIRQLVVIKCNS